ncbi:MAG TPA: hypothetical protein H9958_04825 [Candidatus Limosilactobacillus intestinavium]|nr:hypothetical protein [Candidatus Limosilactobacillus intestinavium]
MKSPEQELFDYVGAWSTDIGYDTYDHLPMESENVPYPFVVIGDVDTVPSANKSSIDAKINLTVNVWGDAEERLVVDQMTSRFLLLAAKNFETEDYHYCGVLKASNSQLIQDTSVPNTILNHGIVQLQFRLI